MSIDMQRAYDSDTDSMMETGSENLEHEDDFDTFFDNEEQDDTEKEVVQS